MTDEADGQAGSAELCGLDGDGTAPPDRNELNRFVRRVVYYHVNPFKKRLTETIESVDRLAETMGDHIRQDEAVHNQIKGAKYALYIIIVLLSFLIPLAVRVIEDVGALLGKG